jgi:hypothetical protein
MASLRLGYQGKDGFIGRIVCKFEPEDITKNMYEPMKGNAA